MTYQPVLPVSGLAGWRLLERTETTQRSTFEQSAQVKRETAYFTANIAKVETVEDLLEDRTLLKVALGAYGLDADITKRGFLRKVLEEGTESTDTFAMRLTDKAYRNLAAAFGFGNEGGVQTGAPGFADTITSAYKARAYEVAVGENDNSLRLALNFRRVMTDTTAARTQTEARAAFSASQAVRDDTAYFAANIGSVTTPEALLADPRLLKVALGTFGLADDPARRADVARALREGTGSPAAFANTAQGAIYRELADAFGFGNTGGALTDAPGFADAITAQYKVRAYELAVGQTEFALTFAGSMTKTISSTSNDANWYTILGDVPLRSVLEKALSIPASVAKLDIERQAEIFKDRAASVLGTSTATALADPATTDEVIRRFLLREQIDGNTGGTSATSAALTLLQGGSSGGSSGLLNLLLSRG